eukprot:COSAG01_NODE_5226_length_4401_cov_5.008601_1_plen_80_part_00
MDARVPGHLLLRRCMDSPATATTGSSLRYVLYRPGPVEGQNEDRITLRLRRLTASPAYSAPVDEKGRIHLSHKKYQVQA